VTEEFTSTNGATAEMETDPSNNKDEKFARITGATSVIEEAADIRLETDDICTVDAFHDNAVAYKEKFDAITENELARMSSIGEMIRV
jgi:hypothetical protein